MPDQHVEIRKAEVALRAAQHKLLEDTGWKHTSNAPGFVWYWEKTLPDGRTVLTSTESAVNMQRYL